MRNLTLPKRDGMPIDIWAVTWILSLFLLLLGLGVVFYVTGRLEFRELRQTVVWTLAVSAYYFARIAHVNHRYLDADAADQDLQPVARSKRDRWSVIAVATALVTVGLVVLF